MELKGSNPRLVAHLLVAEQHPAGEERPPTLDVIAKQLLDAYSPARDVVRLVKLWATNHGLAAQHEEYLNGIAWTFLVVFFLQREGLVPAYAAVASAPLPAASEERPLAGILCRFFEFLRDRATAANHGISVMHAQEFRCPSRLIVIEDPAEFLDTRQQRNLAQTLGERQWAQIVEEARRAAERLTSRPQRWFHWAEIFDPREVPPDRLEKAEPLQALAVASGLLPELGPAAPKRGLAGAMAKEDLRGGPYGPRPPYGKGLPMQAPGGHRRPY